MKTSQYAYVAEWLGAWLPPTLRRFNSCRVLRVPLGRDHQIAVKLPAAVVAKGKEAMICLPSHPYT